MPRVPPAQRTPAVFARHEALYETTGSTALSDGMQTVSTPNSKGTQRKGVAVSVCACVCGGMLTKP